MSVSVTVPHQHMHYINTKKLRLWFIQCSGISKKHEAYKIWARWIITYQSLQKQQDCIIPVNGIEHDLQTVIEMTSKGMKLSHAQMHYKSLIDQCYNIAKSKPDDRFPEVEVDVEVEADSNTHNELDIVVFKAKQRELPELRITVKAYNKLNKQYCKHKQPWKGIPGLFNSFCYSMIQRYDLLDGNSLQWAIPRRLFMFLNKSFQCDTELFASPLNTYFKKYYSLFDEDKYFGSLGNFFNAPDSDFQSGCYEVNPPFIEVLFNLISKRIISLLQKAELNNEELTFIYIMPDWNDLRGYDIIADNRYCKKIIKMEKGKHYYHHGEAIVKASFNSKMLLLSTKYNICSEYEENQIRWCWSSNN